MTTTCCPTLVGPVMGLTYVPTGKMITLACGVQAYVTGSGNGNQKALLATYDIFGFHPTTQQTCDILAKNGYVVIVPDFFKGKPWPLEPWPPADFSPLIAWVGEVGTYPVLRNVFVEAVSYLIETEKIVADKIGGIGFCWGAKPMFAAHADGLIKAIASPHPSFLDVKDAEAATSPVCLLPTRDDPAMEDIEAVLKSNSFASQNVFRRFNDVHHGFLAARGDWQDATQAQNAQAALAVLISFFQNAL